MTLTPDRKKALIAGATGVVGRNLLRHLLTLGDWDVTPQDRSTSLGCRLKLPQRRTGLHL